LDTMMDTKSTHAGHHVDYTKLSHASGKNPCLSATTFKSFGINTKLTVDL
jgi:hypothetical protein